MELFNLGHIPWSMSQTIYHALAELGREALCLVSPASPYVCIGYHQDVEQEVDLDFCQAGSIPVFRREVGGGAVFLDGRQLFFQIILHKSNPVVPLGIEPFYRKFLEPLIEVHHRLGLPAEYRPVNDLVVNGRKISGTGAGEIGECLVFVGNLILDFDYTTMSRVLKVPDEKFRDKVKKTIEENLTTIRRELGPLKADRWTSADLNRMMAEEFGRLMGPLKISRFDGELSAKLREVQVRMLDDAWLYRRGKRVPGRVVKVRAGLEVVHRLHKAPGGLIRADFIIQDGLFREVAISGDFFCFPKEGVAWLESFLEGTSADDLQAAMFEFQTRRQVEWPGIDLSDWLEVLDQP